MHFQCTKLRGIIPTMISSVERESFRKMSLWIFTYARVWPTAINFTFPFSMEFVIEFRILSDILYIFRLFSLRDFIISFFFLLLLSNYASFCLHLGSVNLYLSYLFLMFSCSIIFVLPVYYSHYFNCLHVFTFALPDRLSLFSEWQQVF